MPPPRFRSEAADERLQSNKGFGPGPPLLAGGSPRPPDPSGQRPPHPERNQQEFRMPPMYVPALAAFGGSAFGAISTLISGWLTRRRRRRERHHVQSYTKREKLYRNFIEEASRLYADA